MNDPAPRVFGELEVPLSFGWNSNVFGTYADTSLRHPCGRVPRRMGLPRGCLELGDFRSQAVASQQRMELVAPKLIRPAEPVLDRSTGERHDGGSLIIEADRNAEPGAKDTSRTR